MRAMCLFAAMLCCLAGCKTAERGWRVAVPVADLRAEPLPRTSGSLEHDPLQESQLLYGEPVVVLEERGDWVRVEAPDQPEWSHAQQWQGYPGWLRSAELVRAPREWAPNATVNSKSAGVYTQLDLAAPALTLPLGSRITAVQEVRACFADGNRRLMAPALQVRLLDGSVALMLGQVWPSSGPALSVGDRLVKTARLLIGTPYLWGGRSPSGIDCSGLTSLVHQVNGIPIPRDAHEQWMKAKSIGREQLREGDLVFLHDPKDPEKVTHVMLYAGEGRVIEAPRTGLAVREIDLRQRLSDEPDRLASFGSYRAE